MRRFIRVVSLIVVTSALTSAGGEALAADPTTADCLSAYDKSVALRTDHKLRAARAQLLVCAAANCPVDVRKECVRRVDELNEAMPTIVFEAKDAAGNDLGAVKVTMDGEAIAERSEGTAISLDPGAHSFTFETAGQAPVTKQWVIRQGEKDRREIVQFGSASAPASPAQGTAPEAPLPPASTPPPDQASHGVGAQRTVAIVAAGVGVVGVAVGTLFGLQSMSKHRDAENACPVVCADQNGVNLWNDARKAGTVSTVGFIVGGVGLAGGAVLWFTAKPASAQVGLGPASLQIRGVW
jgi:hypothetical protein